MANKFDKNNVQSLLGPASKQYDTLETVRENYEQTWRDCAALTLPFLGLDGTESEGVSLATPNNSIGPLAVNVLASKLSLALLPFTTFFRLLPFDEDVKDNDEKLNVKIDNELSSTERQIVSLIDIQALRVPTDNFLKYLIVTGNVLIFKVPNGTIKVFSPWQYTIERDYVGEVIRIVIKEKISLMVLPEEIQEIYSEKMKDQNSTEVKEGVDIYTVIARSSEKKFISYQETANTVIDNTFQTYDKEFMPYKALRWSSNAGEDWGRGIVEQYLGDLRTLEALNQAIAEAADLASKVIIGKIPGTMTSIDDFNNAKNGDMINGDLEKDITTWRLDKGSDLNVGFQLLQALEQRLSKSFLLVTGNIRDSERTTATEVRATTAELESALGGVYSQLAADFQLPLIKLLLKEINPKFTSITQPSIITGNSAISREKDFDNVNTMLQAIAQIGQVMASSEQAAASINFESSVTVIANSLGIDPAMILNTPEQIAAKQEAQAAQQPAGQPPVQPQQ